MAVAYSEPWRQSRDSEVHRRREKFLWFRVYVMFGRVDDDRWWRGLLLGAASVPAGAAPDPRRDRGGPRATDRRRVPHHVLHADRRQRDGELVSVRQEHVELRVDLLRRRFGDRQPARGVPRRDHDRLAPQLSGSGRTAGSGRAPVPSWHAALPADGVHVLRPVRIRCRGCARAAIETSHCGRCGRCCTCRCSTSSSRSCSRRVSSTSVCSWSRWSRCSCTPCSRSTTSGDSRPSSAPSSRASASTARRSTSTRCCCWCWR